MKQMSAHQHNMTPALNATQDAIPSITNQATTNQMWGGRFAAGPSAVMQAINASIGFDQKLWAQDIRASRAHAAMLATQGIIAATDAAAIDAGLAQIADEIAAGTFVFSEEREDIHMNIEARLAEIIGPAAGRLHTARSRNDQVATDFRLWVRDACDRLEAGLTALQTVLIDRAAAEHDTIMPGFTHLQTAQPVSFGHHLLAYVEMFGRDRSRMRDNRRRLNESPLGAAALAGTSFPIDRGATAAALGFDRPMANSMDAVSDRDFALDYLSAAAICATHLSRLAEELVIWTTPHFNFVRLSDGFSTGSSIMPQKRNPDAAELVRAKTGRVNGALIGLLTVMKGLPLTYSKDMQEDKVPVFEVDDIMALALTAMTGMIRDLTVNRAAMRAATDHGFITATDLADWLVRVVGVPFREAHHITGKIVALAEQKACKLSEVPLAAMQEVDSRITADVFSVLDIDSSLSSRNSLGGTAPACVRAAIDTARERFLS